MSGAAESNKNDCGTDIMTFDEEQFIRIFEEIYPSLCRFLESLLGDHGAAQDIAQESFMRLFRDGSENIKSGEERFWLFRVARNLALNELRNTKKRDGFVDKIIEVFYQPNRTQAERFERVERDRMVIAMLETLPEHQRAVLLLREQEEMSYAEIADVLDVSESKVKIDIFRARNSLRKKPWRTNRYIT